MKSRITPLALALCAVLSAQDRPPDIDDRQQDREEWFYNQRAFPFGQIPAGARINAIAEIQRITRASRARRLPSAAALAGPNVSALDAGVWTSIGPRPTDQGSASVTAGRVNAIAIDPRDNNTVYIGAAAGGIWKTTDGGANWKPITDDQPSLAMGSIALDPANPDIIYAGTGEENFSQDSYYGAGILKSMNKGATWTNIVGPFLRDSIGSIAVSPSDSNVVLCASATGIWRSADGAATWKGVLTGTGTSIVFDPSNGNIVYAALGNVRADTSNGIFRSTDGGLTWNAIRGSGTNALPSSNLGRIDLAIAPSTPTTIFAAISFGDPDTKAVFFGHLLGIYKSTDGGGTWNSTNAPDICNGVAQCWYDLTVRVNPKNPNVIWAAGSVTVARSLNGGASWNQIPFTGPNGINMHVDTHYLAYTPDGTKLFVANDGGVYSTTDVTGNQVSWTELNDTLALVQFYPGMSVHPADSNIAFGGAQDNGTQRYNGRLSWNNVTCGDGGYTVIDSAVSSIALAACQNIQILRSSNAGGSWSVSQHGIASTDRVNFIPPMVNDPSDPQTMYFGTYRLWQSRDGGGKWNAISPDLSPGTSGDIRAIAVSPSDNNIVYVGSSNTARVVVVPTRPILTTIQVTNNALAKSGASWVDRSAGLPPRVVTHIAVDPLDSATAYATFAGFSGANDTQGHIFKTRDFGANWSDISGNLPNLPINVVVVDPDLPGNLYIGTDSGVLASTDGGVSWSALGNGLPNLVVHAMVLHRTTRTLRVATHGRSMWDIVLPLSSASRQPSIAAVSPSSVNAGSASFNLSVTGSNFVAGAVLRWNGQSRPTNVVDGGHLSAQIGAADIAQVGRVSIDIYSASTGGGASNPVAYNIGPAPATVFAGFVSAANPFGSNALAPGSIASLYGTNFAGTVSIADAGTPLPVTLAGTSISIFNAAAPLFFVSPGQINFQIPWIIASATVSVPLTVTQGQLTSPAIAVPIAQFSPALFTTNSQGTGQASALIAGTATIVAPAGAFPDSRPAKKNEFVSLYCTGLGDVNRRPVPGAASPTTPPSTTMVQPTVSIGTAQAVVSFSGLAPGFAGLYQVNIQIPQTAPSGAAVPVILTIGGVKSNTATIAIE